MPLNVAILWTEGFAYTNGALTPRGGWTTVGGTLSHLVLGNLCRSNPSTDTYGNEIDLTGLGWGEAGNSWALEFSMLPDAVADQAMSMEIVCHGANGNIQVRFEFAAGWNAGSTLDNIDIETPDGGEDTGSMPWSPSSHLVRIEVTPTVTRVYLDGSLIGEYPTGDTGTMESIEMTSIVDGDIARWDTFVLSQWH